uniref:Uncharacterized protein n=1 Tax=Meloidogyne incognita TaxID=6306 RepID=A0A914KFX6_MELIC
MFKILILTCLIIKTHSWTWKDYPSPRGPNYLKCGVSRPGNVCDPDGMLTDQQREEIVQLVEDFKEKTKRPNSMFPCAREGLRLIVALANTAIALGDLPSTNLCNNGGWTSSNTTKFLICLIIQTHSWTWDVYPSPRGTTYWKCGVSKPTWVCDPDGMLTEQQREEIVQLVEDFKEKTKRPKSRYRCMREGLRLVVALARDKIDIDDAFNDPRKTGLCENGGWVTSDRTTCESDVHGVELNEDGFRYCYKLRWLGHLHTEDLEQINNAWPNSNVPCMREGLRLVVALAKDKIGREDGWNGTTKLCFNDRKWTSLYTTDCDSVVQGIELNSDGFRVCYSLRWLMTLNYDEYKQLGYADEVHLENKNYFDALKNYIENMRMLYIHRFSIFDNPDVSNEERASLQSSNKLEEL